MIVKVPESGEPAGKTSMLPQFTPEVTPEFTPEVLRMLSIMRGDMSRSQIMTAPGLKNEKHFRELYQQAGIAMGVITMTIPGKPRSSKQKYRLTAKGGETVQRLKSEAQSQARENGCD